MPPYTPEPFRIKMVEPICLPSPEERRQADQAHRLARLDGEVEAAQDPRLRLRVPEPHVAELDAPREARHAPGGGLAHPRLRVDEREHALRGGQPVLELAPEGGDVQQGPGEIHRRLHEQEPVAGGRRTRLEAQGPGPGQQGGAQPGGRVRDGDGRGGHVAERDGTTARVLTVDGRQWIVLRWDFATYRGLNADGAGVLELTTCSLPIGGKYIEHWGQDFGEEFGLIHVIEILGGLYTRQGRIADGLKMDRKLVRLEPDNPTAHYNLACSLALTSDSDGALTALEEAEGYRRLMEEFSHTQEDLARVVVRTAPQPWGPWSAPTATRSGSSSGAGRARGAS